MSDAVVAPKRAFLGLKPLHWLGLGLIALAIWLGVGALGSSLTPYVNVAEAKTTGGDVQVMGYPQDHGTISDGTFRFKIKDEMGQPLEVVYRQPKPGNFDQAISVVAIGSYDNTNGVFVAEDLLVKCPSKYQEAAAK